MFFESNKSYTSTVKSMFKISPHLLQYIPCKVLFLHENNIICYANMFWERKCCSFNFVTHNVSQWTNFRKERPGNKAKCHSHGVASRHFHIWLRKKHEADLQESHLIQINTHQSVKGSPFNLKQNATMILGCQTSHSIYPSKV